MVKLEKGVAKVESTTDTTFEAFISEMDEFIQEMHEENRLYAEIHELYKKNQMLNDENQALKEELHRQKEIHAAELAKLRQQNNIDTSEKTSKNDNDEFKRQLKITDFWINIFRLEVALIIIWDIYIFIK